MSHIVCQEIGNCKVTDYAFVRRILVPFNDARHAPNVFGFAMTLAKIMGASITIVSIVNKDLQRSWVNGTPSREKSIKKKKNKKKHITIYYNKKKKKKNFFFRCNKKKRNQNVERHVIRKSF